MPKRQNYRTVQYIVNTNWESEYFRFWDLSESSPQKFQGFLFGGGRNPPPPVINPDIISHALLFPSEGIEMMSRFTNCTCK